MTKEGGINRSVYLNRNVLKENKFCRVTLVDFKRLELAIIGQEGYHVVAVIPNNGPDSKRYMDALTSHFKNPKYQIQYAELARREVVNPDFTWKARIRKKKRLDGKYDISNAPLRNLIRFRGLIRFK